MAVGQVFHVAWAPRLSPGPGLTYCILVRCQGGVYQAFVDMGCMQILVHQSLVCPTLEAELVKVKCVHEDVHEYPIVPLLIKFKVGMHSVKAAVSSHLSHPINLSTNCLGFKNLLGQYVGMQS